MKLRSPHSSIFLLLLLSLSIRSVAQDSEFIAGRVTMTYGDAEAVDQNNARRELARRSDIYEGESVETHDQSSIQLRMVDSALISLGCTSTLKIENYIYEDAATDAVTLRLLRGVLRTITGQVGEQYPDRYRLLVGDTRLEVRGTDIEVRLDEDGTIYIANYDGGITVRNPLGSVDLGIGGDTDFAIVEPDKAPRGLRIQPQQLAPTPIVFQANQQIQSPC